MKTLLCIPALALLVGCGSSSMLIKQPVVMACQSRGIRGCDKLTDGVLAYVDGDKATGEAKIVEGVKANEPKQMVMFADALDKIATQFGLTELHSVVELLKGAYIPPSPTLETPVASVQPLTQQEINALDRYNDKKPTCVQLTQAQIDELSKPRTYEVQHIPETPTNIFVCSDTQCTKFEAVKRALLCLNDTCTKWSAPIALVREFPASKKEVGF